MVNRFAAALLGMAFVASAAAADKNVYFVGDFETGSIQSNGSRHDGFYVGTLPDRQVSDEIVVSGKVDLGPDAHADTRVVRSEQIGGQTVLPRRGEFFLRSEVFKDKNYFKLNADVKNKPRSKVYMSNESHKIDFDEEGYTGFSIFVPSNFEHELGVRDHRGDSMLFEMASDSSRTLVNLGVWVQKPNTEAHWYLRVWNSDKTTEDEGLELIDLGPVRPDTGKWTDFVFRYRFNPFDKDTNPAAEGIPNSKDRMYPGNKGILQVWKAEGPVGNDGNRTMALLVDKVNQPVGLVPHKTDGIKHLWRIYKYGWLKNPSTLTRPVWFGFDEIRQGMVARDGTTFADVVPSGLPCTSGCDNVASVKPTPPSGLAVD